MLQLPFLVSSFALGKKVCARNLTYKGEKDQRQQKYTYFTIFRNKIASISDILIYNFKNHN